MTDGPVPTHGYLVTQAVVYNNDDTVNSEKSSEALNQLAQSGWELIVVDQGIAFWRLDVSDIIEAAKQDRTCGTCTSMRGNLCEKHGTAVSHESEPMTDTCHSGDTSNHDGPANA